jgi:hypothetical protein
MRIMARRYIYGALATLALGSAPIMASAQGVSVYADCNYGGAGAFLVEGDYHAERLEAETGLSVNTISSVHVDAGFEILLAERPGFEGRAIVLTGPVGVPCLTSDDFNDMTSSMVVWDKR